MARKRHEGFLLCYNMLRYIFTYLLLHLRWLLVIVLLVFLVQSFISRSLHSSDWRKYFLYLTNWGRVLAVLTYTWEAVLVTSRWRRELDGEHVHNRYLQLWGFTGQVELSLTSSYAATGSPLPWSHRFLWMFANVNSGVSALCSIVYWPFLYTGQHPLNFENITGHGLLTGINVIDLFISARYPNNMHNIILCVFSAGHGAVSMPTMSSSSVLSMFSQTLPT